MSGRERRTAPRKPCSMSLRFRLKAMPVGAGAARTAMSSAYRQASTGMRMMQSSTRTTLADFHGFEGETVNLSERGIYFRSSEKLDVGEPIELFFTLPTELTGRSPEDVKCHARVVHVDPGVDAHGRNGVGAAIEKFESANRWRSNWDN